MYKYPLFNRNTFAHYIFTGNRNQSRLPFHGDDTIMEFKKVSRVTVVVTDTKWRDNCDDMVFKGQEKLDKAILLSCVTVANSITVSYANTSVAL